MTSEETVGSNRQLTDIKKYSWKRKLLIAMAVIFAIKLVFSGANCDQWVFYYNRSIEGQVVDADTGIPVENALVVAMWQLSGYVSEGFDGYAKIIVEKTDSKGRFKIPFWVNFKPWKIGSRVHDIEPKVIIYKPGYNIHTSAQGKVRLPDPQIMSDEELRKAIEEHSINPAKLRKVRTDAEIWNIYMKFRSEANLSTDDYTAKQFTRVFDLIKRSLVDLPRENGGSRNEILSDMKQYER